jgi:hypothetical protein
MAAPPPSRPRPVNPDPRALRDDILISFENAALKAQKAFHDKLLEESGGVKDASVPKFLQQLANPEGYHELLQGFTHGSPELEALRQAYNTATDEFTREREKGNNAASAAMVPPAQPITNTEPGGLDDIPEGAMGGRRRKSRKSRKTSKTRSRRRRRRGGGNCGM